MLKPKERDAPWVVQEKATSLTIVLQVIRVIYDVVVIDEKLEFVVENGDSEVVVIGHEVLVVTLLTA